jgi:hypothetical protein
MSTSDLDLLIEMGFPKERAEIAAKKGGCMFIWLFSQSILTHRRSTTSFTMAGG